MSPCSVLKSTVWSVAVERIFAAACFDVVDAPTGHATIHGRGRFLLAELFADVVPAHVGQTDVEQDHLGLELGGRFDGARAVAGGLVS